MQAMRSKTVILEQRSSNKLTYLNKKKLKNTLINLAKLKNLMHSNKRLDKKFLFLTDNNLKHKPNK